MTNYKTFFKNKKVTVMGLGLLGRGVGDIKFLAELGAELIVTDLKPEEELADSLEQLAGFKNITYHLGKHQIEDFQNRDLVIKAAGVPLDSPYLAASRTSGVPVVMSTALAVSLLPEGVLTVGVTGTRGKSTVTHLIHHILQSSSRLDSRQKNQQIFLGGNVRGVSTLALLPKIKSGDALVLELDSWQLQGFGEAKISPHLAVFTNLLPDHLNYYRGSMEKYFADKANIFTYQKTGDYTIASPSIALRIKTSGELVVASADDVPRDWQIKLPGEHNRQNVALALKAAQILGVEIGVIKQAVESFAGVPGRLELVRTWRNIKIYNDTTSTTPDALIVGLQALGSEKKVVLIAGGADKNLDLSELVKVLPKYCKNIILLPGSGTNKLKSHKLETSLEETSDLSQAVARATAVATSGDTILFSPGFASFGPPPGGFKNEFDRGEQFDAVVKNLE